MGCGTASPASTVPSATSPTSPTRAASTEPAIDIDAFRKASREVDLDRDGYVDLIHSLPAFLEEGAEAVGVFDALPAVVAHGLAEGRYTLDDEFTRAALRTVCPEARWQPPPDNGDWPQDEPGFVLTRLFLTGFCARAWGADANEAERQIRAFAQTSAAVEDLERLVDTAVRAMREAVIPITLRPLANPSLRGWRAAPIESETVPADSPPVVLPQDPRCAEVMPRNRQQVSSSNKRAAAQGGVALEFGEDVLHCAGTSAGVWTLQYGAAKFEAGDVDAGEDPTVAASVSLVWVPAAGKPVVSANLYEAHSGNWSLSQPSVVKVFDWDGDGTPEVVVRESRWSEGGSPSNFRVYALRDGAVVRFEPASGLGEIIGVRDVEGDGRPDVVIASPWMVTNRCSYDGSLAVPGPSLVAHSLRDGSFSKRDEVARAWVASQCARAELERSRAMVDVIDIACARVWGQSPEAVVAGAWALTVEQRRRDPAVAASAEYCLPFAFLAWQALLTPPFETLTESLPRLP
jgi:hypothetical protein